MPRARCPIADAVLGAEWGCWRAPSFLTPGEIWAPWRTKGLRRQLGKWGEDWAGAGVQGPSQGGELGAEVATSWSVRAI